MAEASKKVGYGEQDFAAGGGFSAGRVIVTSFRVATPKPEKSGVKTGVTAVILGRDPNGTKVEIWLTLGGDVEEANKKFYPLDGGKALGSRSGAKPSGSSKYGIFMKSLRDDVKFPMARFSEKDFAALDGCTLDIDSRAMQLSSTILEKIKREGKNPPVEYFVKDYKLPDGGGEVEASDDDEGGGPEGKLLAFVTKAVAKAGEPVAISVLKSGLAVKFEDDADLEAMVPMLKLAWCEAKGFEVDKAAKTVGAAGD